MLLVVSIVLLVMGVLLAQFFRTHASWSVVLEGFVSVFVGGVILFELLPHSYERIGLVTGLWVVGGLLLMALAELWSAGKNSANEQPRWRKDRQYIFSILALLLGFGAHAFVDGASLAVAELQLNIGTETSTSQADATGGLMLALAVIAHRFPIGLAIGLMVLGRGRMIAVSAVLIASTIAGYVSTTWFANPGLALQSIDLAVLQAVACGSLLHVVFGHPLQERVIPRLRVVGACASFLCLAFLFTGSGHAHLELTAVEEAASIESHLEPEDAHHHSTHQAHTAADHHSGSLQNDAGSSSLVGQWIWFIGSFALLCALSWRPLRFLCFGQHQSEQNPTETM